MNHPSNPYFSHAIQIQCMWHTDIYTVYGLVIHRSAARQEIRFGLIDDAHHFGHAAWCQGVYPPVVYRSYEKPPFAMGESSMNRPFATVCDSYVRLLEGNYIRSKVLGFEELFFWIFKQISLMILTSMEKPTSPRKPVGGASGSPSVVLVGLRQLNMVWLGNPNVNGGFQ